MNFFDIFWLWFNLFVNNTQYLAKGYNGPNILHAKMNIGLLQWFGDHWTYSGLYLVFKTNAQEKMNAFFQTTMLCIASSDGSHAEYKNINNYVSVTTVFQLFISLSLTLYVYILLYFKSEICFSISLPRKCFKQFNVYLF